MVTISKSPQSANLREYCGWTGNTEGNIVTTGTIYHDTASKGYNKSGKRVFKDCFRAEITISGQRYRHRSKDREDCERWLKAVRTGKIKPTDNKADWWRMEQRKDDNVRIDEIIVSAAEEAVLLYDYHQTGEDIGAVPVLKRLLAEGHQLVLMTGIEREGELELPIVKDRWDDMLKWVEDNGLTFVGINRNPLEKYRSKKLTADIYIDDHCLGIPTIFDEKRSKRPFVDWDGVEQLLEMMNVLPATPRTHFTVKQPSFQWE